MAQNITYQNFLLEQYNRIKERESDNRNHFAGKRREKQAKVDSLKEELQRLGEENEKLEEQLMVDQAEKVETQVHFVKFQKIVRFITL